jgi:hypothetical protein
VLVLDDHEDTREMYATFLAHDGRLTDSWQSSANGCNRSHTNGARDSRKFQGNQASATVREVTPAAQPTPLFRTNS